MIGTNAETQTYSRLTSATEAEPVPAGLAQAIYAAASVLQYDGAVELTEQECTGVGGAGHAAESDRRPRGMGGDGGADPARGGDRSTWGRRGSRWVRRSISATRI